LNTDEVLLVAQFVSDNVNDLKPSSHDMH